MNKLLSAAALSLALVLGACSSNDTVKEPASAASHLPSWVEQPTIDGMLVGVGIAQANPLGDKMQQRTSAINNGRLELANQIRTRVQAMYSQLNQQTTTAGTDGKELLREDVASRITENTAKQLTDQQLTGSKVNQIWTDPKDGDMYAQVVISQDSIDQALNQIAKSQIQQEIDRGSQELQGALDRLDDAIKNSKENP